jgi:hypothetical protein
MSCFKRLLSVFLTHLFLKGSKKIKKIFSKSYLNLVQKFVNSLPFVSHLTSKNDLKNILQNGCFIAHFERESGKRSKIAEKRPI